MKFWNAMGHSLFYEDGESQKTRRILRVVFFLYLLVLMKVIVFKYPLSELAQITARWKKDVILEGLGTANFTLFKTIDMYIRYWGRLNSFENLFGNIFCFVPFGFLLPFLNKSSRKWPVLLLDSFLLVCGIEIFQRELAAFRARVEAAGLGRLWLDLPADGFAAWEHIEDAGAPLQMLGADSSFAYSGGYRDTFPAEEYQPWAEKNIRKVFRDGQPVSVT